MAKLTALVLAGRRDGVVDPLAAAFGMADKCMVPVGGEPLITHVLRALEASDNVLQILVSINEPAVIEGIPLVKMLVAKGRLRCVKSQANLAESIFAAAEGIQFPLLVTTADNALFTPQAVAEIQNQAEAAGADAVVAFARRTDILSAHPDGQRRFYPFADDAYSNCNCYWIGHGRAMAAAEVFRGGGQFAKHPLRILNAFGLLNLVRFKLGLGTLARAFERFSDRFGLKLRPVCFADGALAIDVDNLRTHAIVEQLLAERRSQDRRNLAA